MIRQFRVNETIQAREVLLVGDNGERLGVMPLLEALRLAQSRNTDLVEVAPNSVPPVCRLLDYGKYKYEQAKKHREARKGQKEVSIREVRLRPKIDEHDIEFKTKAIRKFLEDGDKVKVSVFFRGREITHPQLGQALLDKVKGNLEGVGVLERPPILEGRAIVAILAPAKGKSAPSAPKEA